MVILFKPKLIRLFNLKTKTDEKAESPELVHKLFLDPSGKHLIVSTESNELYYYSRATKKFKSISKLKVIILKVKVIFNFKHKCFYFLGQFSNINWME